MNTISLLNSTGYQKVDEILRGIVGIFETVFPSRIQGHYLCGSYIDGSAVPALSDLDVCIVFKDKLEDSEREKFQQILTHLSRIRPMLLNLESFGEQQLFMNGTVALKVASLVIYGEDIRDKIPMQPIEAFVREILDSFYCLLSWTRRHQDILMFPLSYPDPEGEFYGYDHEKRSPFYLTKIHTTQVLAGLVCAAGTGIIALTAQKYVAKKRDCARVYKACINDEWTEFLEDICETCFNEWKYLIPEDQAGRRKIRELCEKTLAFENHFLTICKDYLLTKLRNADDSNKLHAVQRLGEIIYPDAEVLNALQALERCENEELRGAVKETMRRMQQVRKETMV